MLTQSGMDTCCSAYLPPNLPKAVASGAVKMADIDRMLSNLLTVKMRLGFFDDPSRQPYAQIGTEQICSKQLLSLEAAQQSVVLLKNADAALPLRAAAIKSVAVVGPNGDNPTVQQGNYEGDPCFSRAWNDPLIYTIRQGLQAYTASALETAAPASCSGHFNATVCGCHADGGTIELACPPGGVVVAVQFASLGTPQGVCAHSSQKSLYLASNLTVSVYRGAIFSLLRGSRRCPANRLVRGEFIGCGGCSQQAMHGQEQLHCDRRYSAHERWRRSVPRNCEVCGRAAGVLQGLPTCSSSCATFRCSLLPRMRRWGALHKDHGLCKCECRSSHSRPDCGCGWARPRAGKGRPRPNEPCSAGQPEHAC